MSRRPGEQGGPDEMSEAERSALSEQAAAAAQGDAETETETETEVEAEADASGSEQPGDPGTQRRAGQDGVDGEARPEEEEEGSRMAAQSEPLDESEQATEQWLRRIPDDPGGLLRRKFYYQYRERAPGSAPAEEESAW